MRTFAKNCKFRNKNPCKSAPEICRKSQKLKIEKLKLIFLVSSPSKLRTNYGVAWIELNFYDYHGYQPKIKSRSSKNPGLDKSNLPQISNFGREFVEKSGVQIPVKEGQIFLPLFLFIFKFSIKNCISLFFNHF